MHRKETPESRERSSKFAVCSDGLERHGRFDASITESEEARLQEGFCTRREKLREGEGEGEGERGALGFGRIELFSSS